MNKFDPLTDTKFDINSLFLVLNPVSWIRQRAYCSQWMLLTHK